MEVESRDMGRYSTCQGGGKVVLFVERQKIYGVNGIRFREWYGIVMFYNHC